MKGKKGYNKEKMILRKKMEQQGSRVEAEEKNENQEDVGYVRKRAQA